jgi:hypothetical protein
MNTGAASGALAAAIGSKGSGLVFRMFAPQWSNPIIHAGLRACRVESSAGIVIGSVR